MEERDVESVAELYLRYMQRFDLVPNMSVEEVKHQFLSGRGTGERENGRRDGQVVWTYVIEVSEFRTLCPSQILLSLLVIRTRKHTK